MKEPVRGRVMERCNICEDSWVFWTRDIHSPSTMICPKCGSNDTETLDAEAEDGISPMGR